MRLYEIVFIARQDLQTQEVHQISDQYKEYVKSIGAELKKSEYWGLRSLAYTIKKNKKGHYLFYIVNAKPDLIKKLEDKLRFREDILRFMTFKTTHCDSKPSLMMQSPSN
jgi:small subunit ribosomal protein S6